MSINDFQFDALMAKLEAYIQSNESMYVNALEFEFMVVKMPVGAGKLQIYHNQDIRKKKCVVSIRNTDKIYWARAIVAAQANFEKRKQYDNIKRGRNMQTTLARTLHTETGIPERPCTLDDIEIFARHIQYQIVVVGLSGNIISSTAVMDEKLYILKSENHYDTVTSMKALSMNPYWCGICLKGYDKVEFHKCNKKSKCSMCGDLQRNVKVTILPKKK